MNKIVAVVGPTATGKTGLAISLCKKFNGEIISVDSRQAYREMDIGTGRKLQVPKNKSQTNHKSQIPNVFTIPIHLYGVIEPDKRLSAYEYSRLAWEKINEIKTRNKIPFLVGGTGFYMDVILGRRKLSGIGIDRELRSELESLSKEELIKKLGQLNPEKLKTIDVENKYRLIRTVEISTKSGLMGFNPKGLNPDEKTRRNFDHLLIGLTAENSCLYQLADGRVDRMVEAGLIGEIKTLVEKYGWEAPGLNALGYREFKPYLEGSVQLNESVQKLKYDTHAYIRRQKTYFKKYFPDACWFDVSQFRFEEEAANKVNLFLK